MRSNVWVCGKTWGRGCGRGAIVGLFLAVCIAAGAQAASVTLNFKEADLEAVIGTVAELTGKNFIIDPRVKAKVTIISSKPMSRDEVYQVFLALLQVHGFAAVPSGDVIKIVPDVNAKQSGVPVLDNGEGNGDEMVTRVIQVEHISATQLVPILRPLIPQQGHMVAYPATNTLIISDRAVNIARLMDVIKKIDQPSLEQEIEVANLQHASAQEVVRLLNSLEQQAKQGQAQQGGAMPESQALMVADERTNSILLSGGKSERMRVRALISSLDTPLEATGGINVIYLRYANAKDLVPVLTGVAQNVQESGQLRTAQGGGTGGAQGSPAQAGATGVGNAAAGGGSGGKVSIQADEATNSLVIIGSAEAFRQIQNVVRQLDVRRAQVMVEAIIAEMSLNRAAQLGVQWGVDATPGGDGPIGFTNFGSGSGNSLGDIVAAGMAIAEGTAAAIPNGLTLGIGRFNSDSINFGALIRALQGDGATNVLSTPTLLTLDNKEAEIVVGQEVPFITGSYTNTSGGSTPTNPFQTVNRKEVGIKLRVKPQINEGNTVKLDVEQKVDSLAASSSGAVDLITNTRSIKTTVLVDDRDIIVLGGLITDDLKQSEEKVPLLGDLPLLGNLFRYKSTSKDKTNLMVFLRPVIMREQDVVRGLASKKYNFMRDEQVKLRRKGVSLLPDEEAPVMPRLEDLLSVPPPPVPPPKAGDASERPPGS